MAKSTRTIGTGERMIAKALQDVGVHVNRFRRGHTNAGAEDLLLTVGTRGAGVLIDNLHRHGIAFTLSLVHEMGYRNLSDKKATLFIYAVDNAVPCLDPPA